MKVTIINGASFCHVDRIRAEIQEIDVITEGYHMWHGTIPIFRISAINISIEGYWNGVLRLNLNHRDILLIRSTLDPIA